ncbi:MAG: FAD-binding oxidoreductase [Bdellovibrionales bacterium]|nr:FAD-binding oxidoreductase [Bdellovibrionales bacterium]
MKNKYSFIILGTGISSLSMAHWLSQKYPNDSILLADIHEKFYGASSKNAGFLTVGSFHFFNKMAQEKGLSTATELLQFCQTNHDLLFNAGFLDDSVEYKKDGSYTVTSSAPNMSQEFFKKIPAPIAIKGHEFCHHYALDGSCHPQKLLNKIFKSLSVDLVENAKISFDLKNLTINDQTLAYDKLFVTTNAWLNQILPTPLVSPQRAQILKTKPTRDFILKGNFYFSDHLIYLRQNKAGQIIVGGLRTLDAETEATDQLGTNTKIQNALLQFVKDRLSKNLELAEAWSGIMGFTENHLPCAGQYQESSTYFMGGFSGHGMGMAFHLAKRLVDSLENPNALPKLFTLS